MQNHQIHPITWSGRLWCFFVPGFTKTMAIKQELAWWKIRNKIETNNRLCWPLHIFKQLSAVLLCVFLVSSNISNDRSSSTSTSSVYSTWTTEFLPSSRLLSLAHVDTSSLRTSRSSSLVYVERSAQTKVSQKETIPLTLKSQLLMLVLQNKQNEQTLDNACLKWFYMVCYCNIL